LSQSLSAAVILQQLQGIEDVPLTLRAELDRRTISFRDLIGLDAGSVITLSRATGENIDLYAGDVLIGSGEILVVDGALAVRIAYLRDKAATVETHESTNAELGKAE